MKVIIGGAGWDEAVEVDGEKSEEVDFWTDCIAKGLQQRRDRGVETPLGLIMSVREEGGPESDDRWVLTERIMEYVEDRMAGKALRQERERLCNE